MAITATQKEQRNLGIGSSDAPALLSFDRWGRTPYDIWLERTGQVPPRTGDESFIMEIGTALEPFILKKASEKVGMKAFAPTSTLVHKNGVMRANVDGMFDAFKKGKPVLEAKSSRVVREGFGEPGTAEVPDDIMCQVQHQLACAESDIAYVAKVDFVWGQFDMFVVPRNEDYIKMLEEAALTLWECIKTKREPTGHGSMDYLKQIKRTEGKTVEIAGDIVKMEREAKRVHEEAEAAYEAAKAALVQALGDADGATTKDGFKISYKSQSRAGIDKELLTTKFPDVAKEVATSTTFRVLRVTAPSTKGKKGGAS